MDKPVAPQAPLNVQSFLDTQPFSRFQWQIFALCFLTVLLDGFDTGAVGFVAPSLLKEWSVERPALAPVLSGALFGLAAGALFAGPLADRFGRKRVLVTSVAIFGVASLGCAFANNLTQLTSMRFVTGLGLGAAMPNAVTLMSEYCPIKSRATLTNAMFCGFPLGAALRIQVTVVPATGTIRCTVSRFPDRWTVTATSPLPAGRFGFGAEGLQMQVQGLAIYDRAEVIALP